MAQRRNGNFNQFPQRRSGSERRGMFAVPRDTSIITPQQQSAHDRSELIKRIRQRHEEAQKQAGGLGNRDLPVFKHKAEIVEMIEANKAVVVGGATGSGKSTQVPQYLYEAGYDKTFVLVPRRVIANGLYERLHEELVDQMGESAEKVVGIIHGERVEYDQDNKIVVLTPQTFSKMESQLREEYKDAKVAVIVDEIHEANLNSEIAAGIAGSTVSELDSWRLIASSATHDLASLVGPLSKINGNNIVPSVEIEGRPFNVEFREEPDLTPMELYATIGSDYEKSMIFTSGKKEIDYVIDKTILELEKRKKGSSHKVVFRKLHGELTEVELAQINDPIPNGSRLVIVSSPAGNSGITIPGTQLVITDGTVNRAELDEEGSPGLVRHQASRAEIVQQIGRAGRDVVGGVGYITKPVAYRDQVSSYEEEQLGFKSIDARDPHAPADIYSTKLGRTALEIAGIGRRLVDVNNYLPHSIEESDVSQAETLLDRIGALDDDGVITPIGESMDQFALSPELARGIVEMHQQGRPQQQLARAALIAAAIEVGGLQDFTDKENTQWRTLLSDEVNSDYSAQLELFMQVGITEYDRDIRWMREYALHPKRVQQARKVAAKVLRALRMNPENISLSPITLEERRQLFRDMTAGMIDLVYEQAGKNRQQQILFRNIHGDDHSTRRVISGRSLMDGNSPFIAGFPRWFIDKQGKTHHIIEHAFPVEPEEVAEFAEQNGVLGARVLSPTVRDDKVVEMEQPMFGSIIVGQPRVHTAAEVIPRASQELLMRTIQDNPGRQYRSLLDLAKRLQLYKERLPEGEFEKYLRDGHPEIITVASIQNMLQEYVKHYRSKGEIEDQIRQRIYSERISLNEYLYNDAIIEISRRIPNEIHVPGLGSMPHRVHYQGSVPYLTSIRPSHYRKIQSPILLPDGREVLIQVKKPDDRGTMRVSVEQLNELLQ